MAGTGGLLSWLVQRATAVLILVAGAAVAFQWITRPSASRAELIALLMPGWMRVAIIVLFASVALHAYIGVRDVLMDYLKPRGIRVAARFAAAVIVAGEFAWVLDLMGRVQ